MMLNIKRALSLRICTGSAIVQTRATTCLIALRNFWNFIVRIVFINSAIKLMFLVIFVQSWRCRRNFCILIGRQAFQLICRNISSFI